MTACLQLFLLLWTGLLESTSITGNAVGCSMVTTVATTNCEEFCEMKIVKCARYVGTMIGLERYLHRWTAPRRNFIPRTRKNASTKSLFERLVDFKIYALSVLGYLGSVSAPDRATLTEEAHALQCITAGPYNAIPTDLLRAGSTCGLGPDTFGIHTLSLSARERTCESGCAYHGITDFVTNTLMKVQHVAVSENSVHNYCVPRMVIWTWRFVLSRQT